MIFLKQKWFKITVGILIGLIALPTVTLGGTFVLSLIQGKTADEAVQILAERIDSLIGRVNKLENNQIDLQNSQKELEAQQSELEKLKACTLWSDYVKAKEDIEYFQQNDLIDSKLNIIDPLPNGSQNQLDREKFKVTVAQFQKYKELKPICETIQPTLSPKTTLKPTSTPTTGLNNLFNEGNWVKLANNLEYQDVVVGQGEEAKDGNMVYVNYVGYFTDGSKFDSSYDRNQPFSFILGSGMVIKGWDLGIVGMKVGGKRKLIIPPDLGYGIKGAGSIPLNTTLNFEVELLDIQPPLLP